MWKTVETNIMIYISLFIVIYVTLANLTEQA